MMSVDRVATLFREGTRFLLMNHEDPDIDGIGSILALGKAILKEKRRDFINWCQAASDIPKDGSLAALRKDFLQEAVQFLDGIPNRRHTTD